jgi:peptidyl-tRNA hydrolase, PTH2 family
MEITWKQVIVVNDSLKLPKGKLAAQAAHAAVSAYLEASTEAQQHWLEEGMPKVVLKAVDEKSLQQLLQTAQSAGIPAALIEDAGRTVIPEGTITCLGLGPAVESMLDEITGDLKLL